MNTIPSNFRHDAKTIAAAFGTPTYVVYEGILKANYDHFCHAFQTHYNNVMVAYSVKTNYLPAILSVLHSQGAGMEVVSGFELYLALHTGVPPSRIIFNGPSKTLDELTLAINAGVFSINADSKAELQKISDLGHKHGKTIDVGIRLSIGTITWKKFGIPLDYAVDTFTFASKLKNVNVRGIHIHIGTDIVHPEPYVRTLDRVLPLMRTLHAVGINLDFIDLGGGFPARGVGKRSSRDILLDALSRRLRTSRLRCLTKVLKPLQTEKPSFPLVPTTATYAQSICNNLKAQLHEYALPEPLLILEPGRAIVNSAVTLLVRVVDIKHFKEKSVMVDGGTNLAPYLPYEAHRIMNVTSKQTDFETVTIAGPLCTESDIISQRADVLHVREGDIIEIFDVGAYSLCQSIQFIKPRAGAVLVRENGERVEVRRRENYRDLVRLDVPFTHTRSPSGASQSKGAS